MPCFLWRRLGRDTTLAVPLLLASLAILTLPPAEPLSERPALRPVTAIAGADFFTVNEQRTPIVDAPPCKGVPLPPVTAPAATPSSPPLSNEMSLLALSAAFTPPSLRTPVSPTPTVELDSPVDDLVMVGGTATRVSTSASGFLLPPRGPFLSQETFTLRERGVSHIAL